MSEELTTCKHCGKEYNVILSFGLCIGCLNYLHNNKLINKYEERNLHRV